MKVTAENGQTLSLPWAVFKPYVTKNGINDRRLWSSVSSTLLGGPVGPRWHGGLVDIALLDCGAAEVKNRLQTSPILRKDFRRLSLILRKKKNAQGDENRRWPQLDQLKRGALEEIGNPEQYCEVCIYK